MILKPKKRNSVKEAVHAIFKNSVGKKKIRLTVIFLKLLVNLFRKLNLAESASNWFLGCILIVSLFRKMFLSIRKCFKN